MNDQRSLTEQLQDAALLAARHGLYDAADFIQAIANGLLESQKPVWEKGK